MRYCFQIFSYTNIHYQESLPRLAQAEMAWLLRSLSLQEDTELSMLCGQPCLLWQGDRLTDEQLRVLASHSAVLALFEEKDGWLRPLDADRSTYLPDDLSEVLKYKGKTNTVFTRMMLNIALSAAGRDKTRTVLDPMCGRGTTLFAALESGHHAAGIDLDKRDLKEADDYFARYLEFHRLKHSRNRQAMTVRNRSLPDTVYTVAADKEAFRRGDTRTLRLLEGDASLAGAIFQKRPADILVTDLPYGIQHAPQTGQKPESFDMLMRRCLPAWRQAIRKDGACVISFNALTLKKEKLSAMMTEAGWTVITGSAADGLEHFVEQAVSRDLIIALNR